MDYNVAWDEMYDWLSKGKDYLEKRLTELSTVEGPYFDSEYKRIEGKLDGIKTCIYHMDETKKIYGGSK